MSQVLKAKFCTSVVVQDEQCKNRNKIPEITTEGDVCCRVVTRRFSSQTKVGLSKYRTDLVSVTTTRYNNYNNDSLPGHCSTQTHTITPSRLIPRHISSPVKNDIILFDNCNYMVCVYHFKLHKATQELLNTFKAHLAFCNSMRNVGV